ncbi:CRISPR-associated endonuclease Cas3'' [Kitasatospora sp. NRRL B-11411]|uniref:CRISPR-associated endonuclease Cas3'' n=1 Tax=Kitasatospora sp. NRRL B-11411 TaxID=1463822 RepID=UPI0004C329D7|nr:CRISPR-associated endonuclease Cas3'' [Kitasatospora sp. NRRL B-11411]
MSALDPGLPAKQRGLEKPYSAGCHALDAAVMAARLWDAYLTPNQRHAIATGWNLTEHQARTLLVFLAALHDLAKISPAFLSQLGDADHHTGTPGYPPAPPGEHLRHDRGVHLALPELLHRLYRLPLDDRPLRLVAHQLAQILGGHHGLWHPALSHQGDQLTCPLDAAPALGHDQWDTQREALLRLAADRLGDPPMPTRPAPAPAAVLVTGTVMLADWLVSQAGWIRARQRQWKNHPGNWAAHLDDAQHAAPRALRRAQLTTAPRPKATTFADLFPRLAGKTLHPLQEDLERRLPALVEAGGPGLLLVTAPTGDGKTECGLFACAVTAATSGAAGPCLLLPTMATTDPQWERLREHCRHLGRLTGRRHPAVLLHSAAWLHDGYNPIGGSIHSDWAIVEEWLRGRYRGLLAHACAGTWDQAAIATLPVKFNAIRWLGLTRHVVVIDEAPRRARHPRRPALRHPHRPHRRQPRQRLPHRPEPPIPAHHRPTLLPRLDLHRRHRHHHRLPPRHPLRSRPHPHHPHPRRRTRQRPRRPRQPRPRPPGGPRPAARHPHRQCPRHL